MMIDINELAREIENKKKELEELKRELGQTAKEELLNSLVEGGYFAITRDKSYESYQTIYICKFTGDNIYVKKDLGSYKIAFDGPVIIKTIIEKNIGSDKYKRYIDYRLDTDAEDYLYDKLFISKVDINEVKKAIRSYINKF